MIPAFQRFLFSALEHQGLRRGHNLCLDLQFIRLPARMGLYKGWLMFSQRDKRKKTVLNQTKNSSRAAHSIDRRWLHSLCIPQMFLSCLPVFSSKTGEEIPKREFELFWHYINRDRSHLEFQEWSSGSNRELLESSCCLFVCELEVSFCEVVFHWKLAIFFNSLGFFF